MTNIPKTNIKSQITSAFTEYWGWAWADYIRADYSYICSSASGVSALLVCTALHPQMPRRHCNKFSVVPMLIWTSRNSSTVTLIGRFDSHRFVGKMSGSYSSMHCLSRLICLYHVSIHLPVFVNIGHGGQQTQAVVLGRSVECTSIYWNTRSISGCTRISGTRVRQMRGKWYIDTYINR